MTKKTGERSGAKPVERRQVTIYLTTEQWRALKVYAAQHDREMSEVVSEALNKMGIK